MAANEYFNANPNNQQTTNALNRQLMGGMSPVASPSQAGGGSAAYLPGTGGNYAGMSGGSGMSGATSYGQQVASAAQSSGAGAMAGASAGKIPASVANGNSYATALQQAAQPFGGTGAAAAPAASSTPTLEQLYALALESQKAQLAQDQAGLQAAYDRQRQDINDQYNADMIRQAVENQKANLNWNEVQQAYGLSSGTMGQAWLARNNQAQANQTALQAARDKALANIALEQQSAEERYKAELRAAIAQNDYEKAKALYEQALAGGGAGTGSGGSGSSGSGGSGRSTGKTRAYIGSGNTGGYYDLIYGPGAWEEAQAQAKAQSSGSSGRSRTGGKSSTGSEPEATATGAELAGRVQATMDNIGQANAQQNYNTWYNGLNDWQKAAVRTYTEAYNQGKISADELNRVMAGMGAP